MVALVTSCRSALFTRCGAAFSRRGCSCYQLWVRSFHPLWVRSSGFLSPGSSNAESADFAQELVGAAAVLFDVLVCLSVCLSRLARHPHVFRFVFCTLQTCCAWIAGPTSTTPPIRSGSSCKLPFCSGDQPEHGCNHASRVLLRPPGVRPAKASRAEISAPALLPPPLRWPCVSWSVDTSRCKHACFIDRSACLVEPRTCDGHTKCSRLTVHENTARGATSPQQPAFQLPPPLVP